MIANREIVGFKKCLKLMKFVTKKMKQGNELVIYF